MDAQLCRERRMRKILENSASRLQRITTYTVEEDPEDEILITVTKSDPEFVPSEEQFEDSIDFNTVETQVSDTQTTTSLGSLINKLEPTKESCYTLELLQSGIYTRNGFIILLSILVRCLLLFNELVVRATYPDLNKIFMPIFLFEILEYVFFRPSIPQNGALNMLFMLNSRINPDYLMKLCTTVRVMSRIVQDVMVYFFFFVCFDGVITSIY